METVSRVQELVFMGSAQPSVRSILSVQVSCVFVLMVQLLVFFIVLMSSGMDGPKARLSLCK